MGTIKGGIGIMQNMSSEIQNDSIEITSGKILNIDNVLRNRELIKEIHQQSEEEDIEVNDIANEDEEGNEENEENENNYQLDYVGSNNKT